MPATPTSSPEPSLALELPGTTDPRVVSAEVTPQIDGESGTLTVSVTSGAGDRIDELVLRWHDRLGESLHLAPFAPSERIREEARPAPGGRGGSSAPASRGAGRHDLGRVGAALAGGDADDRAGGNRTAPGPVAFDLQLLSGNDLLTLGDGEPAELRVEVP